MSKPGLEARSVEKTVAVPPARTPASVESTIAIVRMNEKSDCLVGDGAAECRRTWSFGLF